MVEYSTVISGERFQQLCDVYCGNLYDLNRNPKIAIEVNKHLNIEKLSSEYDNPRLVFCYSNSLSMFMNKLHLFKNPFVLVSHNEDNNITEEYSQIVNNPLVIKWFAQNIIMRHPKLHLLPIGIANEMWPHGNIHTLLKVKSLNLKKENNIYFFFNIWTNPEKRNLCKNIIESKGLPFGNLKSHPNYLIDLARSKFAISPPGNGVDCHRIWECYYLKVIPIVLRSTFTEIVSEVLPCIILDSWHDFNYESIISKYEDMITQLQDRHLNLNYYKEIINNNIPKSYSLCDSKNEPLD